MARLRHLTVSLLLATAPTWAQDRWAGLYDTATLQHWQAQFRPGLESNLREVLLPRLTPVERLGVLGLRLDMPLRAERHPMNFYADHDAQGPVLSMPVASLRFLGDICLAWAWLNAKGYGLDTVTDYLAILAQRGPEGFVGGSPRPLLALGIPADARDDPRVQRDLQRLFDTAVVFLMAHELGHLQAGHRATSDASQSRQQERAADRFALEIMRRSAEAPVGVVAFFTIASHLDGVTSAAATGRSHPTSPERLHAAAEQVRASAADYARSGTSVDVLQRIASQLTEIAQALQDPGLQALVRIKGLTMRADMLAPRRQGSLPVAAPPPARGAFAGRWRGTWTDHKGSAFDVVLDLSGDGSRLSGSYNFGAGPVQLEGLVEQGQLHYRWRWGSEYFGRGVLQAQTTDGRLLGTWGYNEQEAGAGRWQLQRQP